MNRRGSIMLEATIAAAMAAVLMTICLQLSHLTLRQHRATELRQLAIREADNIMQRLTATDFDELTPELAQQVRLSEEADGGLPGGTVRVEIDDKPGKAAAKRIAVRIEWQDDTGQAVQPVRLVAWRYPTEPAKREDAQ